MIHRWLAAIFFILFLFSALFALEAHGKATRTIYEDSCDSHREHWDREVEERSSSAYIPYAAYESCLEGLDFRRAEARIYGAIAFNRLLLAIGFALLCLNSFILSRKK